MSDNKQPGGKIVRQKIGIAGDHAGFELKEFLSEKLREMNYDLTDFGNFKSEPGDDFPDFVIPLARAVAKREIERGIAICGSGVGACIAANKVVNVRACLITDHFSAHQGVEDDDMNMICLGARTTTREQSMELVSIFLSSVFKNSDRFKRRLGKIAELEINNLKK
jgi:ribose 5-phosphate isomerase B